MKKYIIVSLISFLIGAILCWVVMRTYITRYVEYLNLDNRRIESMLRMDYVALTYLNNGKNDQTKNYLELELYANLHSFFTKAQASSGNYSPDQLKLLKNVFPVYQKIDRERMFQKQKDILNDGKTTTDGNDLLKQGFKLIDESFHSLGLE